MPFKILISRNILITIKNIHDKFLLKYFWISFFDIDCNFLNRVVTCSSSKGRVPQSSAYRTTPQDQISTSGPAYSFPDIT